MVAPMRGYVFVRPIKVEKTTEAGIILADSKKEKIVEAEVISINQHSTEDLQPGDRVFINAGVGIPHDGNMIITEDDIYFKVL